MRFRRNRRRSSKRTTRRHIRGYSASRAGIRL